MTYKSWLSLGKQSSQDVPYIEAEVRGPKPDGSIPLDTWCSFSPAAPGLAPANPNREVSESFHEPAQVALPMPNDHSDHRLAQVINSPTRRQKNSKHQGIPNMNRAKETDNVITTHRSKRDEKTC